MKESKEDREQRERAALRLYPPRRRSCWSTPREKQETPGRGGKGEIYGSMAGPGRQLYVFWRWVLSPGAA